MSGTFPVYLGSNRDELFTVLDHLDMLNDAERILGLYDSGLSDEEASFMTKPDGSWALSLDTKSDERDCTKRQAAVQKAASGVRVVTGDEFIANL